MVPHAIKKLNLVKNNSPLSLKTHLHIHFDEQLTARL